MSPTLKPVGLILVPFVVRKGEFLVDDLGVNQTWKIDYQKRFPVSQIDSMYQAPTFFVAAQHGTRTRNHDKLTGNARQSSTFILFHILKISRIIYRFHVFLHVLQLGSELLNCLVIFSQFLH